MESLSPLYPLTGGVRVSRNANNMENTMQEAMPQVDTEIAETLQWIRQTMESGTDFLTDQAPLYAEELLRYGAFTSSVWMWVTGIACIVVVLLLVGLWILYFLTGQDDDDALVCCGMLTVVGGFVTIGLGIACVCNKTQLYKIEHSPRVYIVEHIR